MYQLVHLRLGGGDNFGIAVAGVHHRDSCEAVEIFFARGVVDDAASGALDHDWLNGLHEAGDDVVVVLLDGVAHMSFAR